ncbi:hypothetical protein SAMN05216241_107132 [Limimonas halophila]|uniref:Nucleotidyltransferase n=1 Tax=Limimonas halophila TaxID=1082479 RepID=A0A1G7SUK8_9PROT|nr:nucleotidyltransferase [Limimonas halophila]SDG25970.1 hypothetical protein SAMN05216241_107132 [Limimonas halophila]
MTVTVEQGFKQFHKRLQPSQTAQRGAQQHRRSIQACLEANFGLNAFRRTGSFGNGTSVANCSDVDYVAGLPPGSYQKDSDRTLKQLRDALARTFPRTGVKRSCPAVVAPFGQRKEEDTEVVPAKYIGQRNGRFDVFAIPNCSGGWMPTSPDAHNAYVIEVNRQRGQKVKPLIRFIKAWKYARQVPISSFYIELFVARQAATQNGILYSRDVVGVFNAMERTDLTRISDPMGVSGNVQPCRTRSRLNTARSRVRSTAKKARQAWQAECNGQKRRAFILWNEVFSGGFPSP